MTHEEVIYRLNNAAFLGDEDSLTQTEEAVKEAVFALRTIEHIKETLEYKRQLYKGFKSGKYADGYTACISLVERILNGEEYGI